MARKKNLTKHTPELEKPRPFSMGILLVTLLIGAVFLLFGGSYFLDYKEAKQLEAEGDVYYELGKYPEATEKYLFASKKQPSFLKNSEIETKIASARSASEEQNDQEEAKDSNSTTQSATIITPEPKSAQVKSGQATTLEFIKNRINQIASEMVANKKVIDEESKLCSQRYPNDLDAAWACADERERKLREASSKYNELKKEFDMLYQQLLSIGGQK